MNASNGAEEGAPHLPYQKHLTSAQDLVTTYEQTRAGFLAAALEKGVEAVPYVEEAKALKAQLRTVKRPAELIAMGSIREALLTAAGVSDKAKNHLTEADQTEAIQNLIERFLDPAGDQFADELIYRFLLTNGDALGGKMRNLAGKWGERKFTRALVATLGIAGTPFHYYDGDTKKWLGGDHTQAGLDSRARGIYWRNDNGHATLLYNLKVETVGNNVDLCLLRASPVQIRRGRPEQSQHRNPAVYMALGELKGGIDPAGADEHWKTANSALQRIRTSFASRNLHPKTFFIGNAIELVMANEIYAQLQVGTMSNAANLNSDHQLAAVCAWIVSL